MINLTIRNIPDNLINKIKILSETRRRSMNSEILLILENGLLIESSKKNDNPLSRDTQIKMWTRLSGEWKDNRKTKEIIDDIYSARSEGRDFSL